MHPAQYVLRRYCDRHLDPETAGQVEKHVETCQFCREFCEEYRALSQFVDQAAEEALPARAKQAAGYLYRVGYCVEPIVLSLLRQEPSALRVPLAADGTPKDELRFENLATFFSEEPEMVLRVMRDNRKQRDFLQLVSDDSSLVSRVLVEVPDLDLSIITDENGRGDFDRPYPDDASDLKWQVKMPQAEFSLLPLQYDPARVEYSEDIVLETVHKDRVAVRFEGQKDGKRISIRILELNGHPDFEPVAVAVSQGGKSLVAGASRDDTLYFEMEGTENSIDIRLFRGQ
ncbi:MAG: hypothetical protein JSW34_02080 [Candidatus Zixiibacteriota bacterium]|nr:MAG: hypothetical protein JSW34_02080 [candidate division Zixibacteria bacterium]